MNKKQAAEFYDYIEEHPDDLFKDIAVHFKITERQATDWSMLAMARVRGEFIAGFPD